jgi:hypothetical protein
MMRNAATEVYPSVSWRKRSAHSGTELAEGMGFEPTIRLITV